MARSTAALMVAVVAGPALGGFLYVAGPAGLGALSARLDKSIPVGNEGA